MSRRDIINQDGSVKWDVIGGFNEQLDSHTGQLADIAILHPNGVDDTTAITNSLASKKEVLLGEGTFLVSKLTLSAGMRLKGVGKGRTILKLKDNANTTLLLLQNASSTELSDLTLDGNKANNTATVTDQTMSVLLVDVQSAYAASSIYQTIKNIAILNGKNNGLYIKSVSSGSGYNWVLQYSGIHILECDGYGFVDESTDNTFSDFYISGCKLADLYIHYASSNKYNNFKTDNGGVNWTSNTSNNDGANIIIHHGQNLQLNNFDCQSGYRVGYKIITSTDLIINTSVDSNGVAYEGTGTNGIGMYLYDSYNITGNLSFSPGYARQGTDLIIDATCYDISFNSKNIKKNKITNNGLRCSITNLQEIGERNEVIGKFYNSVAQSIPNFVSTPTALNFDSATIDTNSMWSAGTITCKKTGWYRLNVRVMFAANINGLRSVELKQNTQTIAYDNKLAVSASYETTMNIDTLIYCNANDTFTVLVSQYSGGALNVLGGAFSELSFVKVA